MKVHTGCPVKIRPLSVVIKTFFVIARFNFKIPARALPVIPPKFIGVHITQSEKEVVRAQSLWMWRAIPPSWQRPELNLLLALYVNVTNATWSPAA
jgi:hypothetical protein